jgi:hypothetical protein
MDTDAGKIKLKERFSMFKNMLWILIRPDRHHFGGSGSERHC